MLRSPPDAPASAGVEAVSTAPEAAYPSISAIAFNRR